MNVLLPLTATIALVSAVTSVVARSRRVADATQLLGPGAGLAFAVLVLAYVMRGG